MAKKLLIATTNTNKVSRIKRILTDVPIEILSFDDINLQPPEPAETAGSGVEIAAQKALAYLEYVGNEFIILTQDDTIEFEGVEPADNPGPFIKEPVIERYGSFNDENALAFYTELATKYGGSIPMIFKYGHAIAFKNTTGRKRISVVSSASELHTKLVDTPHKPELAPGYFLSAIMQVEIDDKWVYGTEMTEEQSTQADHDLKASIVSLLKEVPNNEK